MATRWSWRRACAVLGAIAAGPHAFAADAMPDMPEMAHPMGHAMSMPSAFGPYDMSRDGSGTSWQPDATPMDGTHVMGEDWTLMAHGFVNLIHDTQSGPRGATENFSQSMLMLMAQRDLGPGRFGARAMFSLEPTMGARGYPLLFQTGETADGQTHLVDRQHPHDAVMELSASYSAALGDDGAAFVYAGLPGEPALGPGAFMHRFSGMRNPEAPLTHHWLDSTHVTFGVLTLGASRGAWKLEASSFNAREPDQHRWNIETGPLDSWSTRLSWNPSPAWALQVSYGDLKSPEQLEPETRVKRLTASASWQTRLADRVEWGTTLAWGRNTLINADGRTRLPAWLLESTAIIDQRHTVFGRFEQVDNHELFAAGDPLHDQTFRVRKFELGYVYDVVATGPVQWGLGVSLATFSVPAALEPVYGRRPHSAFVFLQGRL